MSVSILSSVSKVFQKCMFKQISNYMDYLLIKISANLEGYLHTELSFADAQQIRVHGG